VPIPAAQRLGGLSLRRRTRECAQSSRPGFSSHSWSRCLTPSRPRWVVPSSGALHSTLGWQNPIVLGIAAILAFLLVATSYQRAAISTFSRRIAYAVSRDGALAKNEHPRRQGSRLRLLVPLGLGRRSFVSGLHAPRAETSGVSRGTVVVGNEGIRTLREFWVLPDLLDQRRDAILLRLAEVGPLSF
jgi:hypothetical protein